MKRVGILNLLPALALLPGGVLPLSASEDIGWDVMLAGGTRTFDLTWRTAAAPTGNGANPPFTASWDDITTVDATAGLGLRYYGMHLRGELTYGRIIDGSSGIKAYADDSHSQVTYHSEQRSDDGEVREGMLALGLSMSNAANTLTVIGEFGFTHSEQHLTLSDGFQIVPATGAYAGLDSHYDTRWKGAWIGMSGSWRVLPSWTLLANGRFHLVDYYGVMDFNLRTDLTHPRSIEQSGNGYAGSVGVGVVCHLNRSADIEVLLSREEWRIADGEDRVNYSNGTSDDVPLVEVILSAWNLRLGLRWEF